MSKPTTVTETLIEYESMLHASVQRVGRAVRNLNQETGGYNARTPGSGDPGGGKGGGRPTVHISDPSDPVTNQQLEQPVVERKGKKLTVLRPAKEIVTTVVEDGSFPVPVTSVEMQALFGQRDRAAAKLAELRETAIAVVHGLGRASWAADVDPGPFESGDTPTWRIVVIAYARVRRMQRAATAIVRRGDPNVDLVSALEDVDAGVDRVYRLCQTWGYEPGVPFVPKDRAELLAVDLTEQWCTSHLRAGDRRQRDVGRGELCQWCYKFQAAEGFLPPIELVRIHVDDRRVYDHQIAPFRQAHRDRMRNMVKS